MIAAEAMRCLAEAFVCLQAGALYRMLAEAVRMLALVIITSAEA